MPDNISGKHLKHPMIPQSSDPRWEMHWAAKNLRRNIARKPLFFFYKLASIQIVSWLLSDSDTLRKGGGLSRINPFY
jgi:hypothetical protein